MVNRKYIAKYSNRNYEITASSRLDLGLQELWAHRQLIGVMIWKEVLIRYKQTLMGASWVLIQPMITVAVFFVIFKKLMNVTSDGTPYVAFALTGIICWMYFSHAVTKSTNCLVNNYTILNKVYFSRTILPISATLGGLVDFFIAFVPVLGVILFYKIPITSNFIFFPFFLLIVVLDALALGFWLSAINVRYRDVNNILPFLMQVGLFITPVGYSSALAVKEWKLLFWLNPLSGALSGFRWSLLGTEFPSWAMLGSSIGITLVLLISGFLFFKKQEMSFSDIL